MRRQHAGETLQHARVVLNDSYGAHTTLIHIDRRQMSRKFPSSRGQMSGLGSLKKRGPVSNTRHKRAVTDLGKDNLHRATSRRYANSTLNRIFVWNS
jgi:hypothetical protein